MTIFAIGAVMVVPTMFAWVRANAVSMQRDEAARILDREGSVLLQGAWSTAEWSGQVGTTGSLATALETQLDGPAWSDWVTLGPSQTGLETTADVDYATVGITDGAGQQVARVMKLRIQWQGPASDTLQATRILQRNDAP